MKKITCLVLGLVSLVGCGMQLVRDGRSDYTIVIADDAIPAEQSAAKELAQHLEQMSGATLPITTAEDFGGGRVIALGPSPISKRLAPNVDWNGLGKEEYVIRTVGRNVVIAGGRPRGTLYGVYELLQKQLGCRWFTPDTSFVPKRKTITIRRQDAVGNLSFKHREPWMYVGGAPRTGYWWRDHFDWAYVARTRHSGQAVRHQLQLTSNEYGGLVKISHWGHNFKELVPAAKYANDHPEYFALYKEQRTTSGDLALCLTHPDVAAIAAQSMRTWMREDPGADQFFIGQPDSGKRCQCLKCNQAYEKYSRVNSIPAMRGSSADLAIHGGFAGVLLQFANEIANKVEQDFPNNKIGIFLYESSLIAPKNITKVHKNLLMWFCAAGWTSGSGIRCSCHPIHKGPTNKVFWDFPKLLADWKKVAPQADFFVYEYFVPWHLGLPHDLFTIPETVRWYHRHGVKGIFIDSVKEIQSCFGFLRYWLWMQMLNDVNFDFEKGYDEFLTAYYGEAASQVHQFIKLTTDPNSFHPLPAKVAREYLPPDSPHYQEQINDCRIIWREPNRQAMEKMYALFEQAKQAVQDDPKAREHLRAARMTLQHAMVEYLAPNDPRLADEAAGLLATAKRLEMPYIGSRETLEDYRQKISERIGRPVAKP